MRPSKIALFGSFAALVLAALLAQGAPAQIVPEPCPRPGFVVAPGPGSDADRNGNGVVCVDDQGNVSDDVDPPSEAHKDANGDALVCYDASKGVITDDHISGDPSQPTAECPPGFVLVPVFPFLQ